MNDVRSLPQGLAEAQADGIVSSGVEAIGHLQMLSKFRRGLWEFPLALLIRVLLLVAAPLQGRAQFVQIKLDEIVASTPADNCDEVYFVLAGASDHIRFQVSSRRV